MDMILKNTFQSISPAYELIGDVTVGTNTTQVDFTGLSIGKDDELLLVASVINRDNTYGSEYEININSTTTATNYWSQSLYAGGTSIICARFNAPRIGYTGTVSPKTTVFYIPIKITNSGYFVAQSSTNRQAGSVSPELQNQYVTSTFTVDSITSITIKQANSSTTNQISTGSRFQLYKLVAEKVADIIVPSNTTSVDITGLDIGKDGEYYLVSDWVNPTGSATGMALYLNDNTVGTNYYEQYLNAELTGISSGRVNDSNIDYLRASRMSFGTASIKLTNSGYTTVQKNVCREYGSTINLTKYYLTTTFTMASITKLTLVSAVTNAIGANSRFTLYKMK